MVAVNNDSTLGVEIVAINSFDAGARAAGASVEDFSRKVQNAGAAAAGAFTAPAKAVAAVGPQFEKLRGLLGNLGDRYQQTGRLGVQNITALAVAVRELDREHGKALRSAVGLSEAERNIYRSASASLKDAIAKQREFNDVQQQVTRQTRDFTSLQGALEGMNGKFGAIAKTAGGVGLALTEGWRIGRKLDTWLDENLKGWTKWKVGVTDAIVGAFSKANPDLANDPRFAGTRTQQLLPQLIAGQGRAKNEFAKAMAAAEPDIAKSVERGIVGGAKKGAPQAAKEFYGAFLDVGPTRDTAFALIMAGAAERLDREIEARQIGISLGDQAAQSMAGSLKKIDIGRDIFGDIGRDLSGSLTQNFGGALTDLFADLGATGGKNFGEIAAGAMIDGIRAGTDALSQIFVQALGGGQVEKVAGGYSYGGQTFSTQELAQAAKTQKGQELYKQIGASITGGIAGYQGVQANQSGQAGDLETVLSQTAIGASIGTAFAPGIGTLVGAVVGLVVGGISAALSVTGKDYKYGRPSIVGNEARFGVGANIRPNEAAEIEARIQSSFDTVRNGYLKVLLEFNQEIPDLLRQMTIEPIFGKDRGGDFGTAASKLFLQDLDRWITGELPRDVAERFREPFEQVFTGIGFSAQRFGEVWGDLQKLDPAKALELLGVLAHGTIQLFESLENIDPSNIRNGLGGVRGAVGMEPVSFADQMRKSDEDIFRLAESIELLTGEDQIRAWAELGRLSAERYEKEAEYIRGLNRLLDESQREARAIVQGYTLEGIADPQGKIDFLEGYLGQLQTDLMGATTAEDATRLRSEIFGVIDQIKGLGAQMGPDAAEAFRLWAIESVQQVQQQYEERLQTFGDAIDTVNDEFLARVQPVVDTFTQQLSDTGGVAAELGGAFAGLRDEVAATRDVIREMRLAASGDGASSAEGTGAGAEDSASLADAIREMRLAAQEFSGASTAMVESAYVAWVKAGRV